MTTIDTIKKLAASSAIAGVLGLAALGLGSGIAAAAPSTDSGSGIIEDTSHASQPETHELFPGQAPSHSDHDGQGHKGANEPDAPVEGIQNPLPSDSTATANDSSASNTSNESKPKDHELFPVQRGDL